MLPDGFSPRAVKGPVKKFWRDRRTPDMDAVDEGPAVIKINDFAGDQAIKLFRTRFFKKEIMIACNEKFVFKILLDEPFNKIQYLQFFSPVGNIPGMDQYISFRQLHSPVP